MFSSIFFILSSTLTYCFNSNIKRCNNNQFSVISSIYYFIFIIFFFFIQNKNNFNSIEKLTLRLFADPPVSKGNGFSKYYCLSLAEEKP